MVFYEDVVLVFGEVVVGVLGDKEDEYIDVEVVYRFLGDGEGVREFF